MVTVFWDLDSAIHMGFLEPGTAINSMLNCNIQNFETVKQNPEARNKFCWKAVTLNLTSHQPPKRQLQSWSSLSYPIHHTVQFWHHVTTFSLNLKFTLKGIV